jgi:nitrogen fixation protein NifX
MRVAFATLDGLHVNSDLRGAPRLDLYEVTCQGARLQRVCELQSAGRGLGARLEAIAGAELVYVAAIGPSAAARLAAHGIGVATSPGGAPVDALLDDLVRRLRGAGVAGGACSDRGRSAA